MERQPIVYYIKVFNTELPKVNHLKWAKQDIRLSKSTNFTSV